MAAASVQFAIHGITAPGFEPIRDVFERNFTADIEVGASFAAVVDGETVVDLWGGFQDRDCTRPWREDTLVNVYSTTKGIASAALATVVEEGLLDYDAPLHDYWPEFQAGTGGLTVGQFLSHQSGVCGLRDPVSVEEPVRLRRHDHAHCGRGAALGTGHRGWLPTPSCGGTSPANLPCARQARALGQLLRERIAGPLDADFHIGLPVSEHARVADLIGPNHARVQPDPATLLGAKVPPLFKFALQNPSVRPWQDACSAAWRSAEIAAANGHANARGNRAHLRRLGGWRAGAAARDRRRDNRRGMGHGRRPRARSADASGSRHEPEYRRTVRGPIRVRSATTAPAAPLASPTPSVGSASATP